MQGLSNEIFAAGGTSTLQLIMLILGVGGLTVLLLSTRRRIRKSSSESSLRPGEQFARLAAESRTTRELERVMQELDALSRQIHGRIDTKLARLEKLLRDADERIALLSRSGGFSGQSRPTLEILLDKEEPADAVSGEVESGEGAQLAAIRLEKMGRSVVDIARQIDKTPGEVELMLALHKTRLESGSGHSTGVRS